MLVVVAAMLLTMPFEIGFGKESLGANFLLMVPGQDEKGPSVMGLTKSVSPLTKLVKGIVGSGYLNGERRNFEGMAID